MLAIAPRRRKHARRHRRLAWQAPTGAALLLLAGSCAAPPPPAPAPRPAPATPATPPIRYQPTAPAALDWKDLPITPGDWRWAREGAVSVARFWVGPQPVLTIACRGQSVVLSRSGTPADGAATPTVVLRAGAGERPLAGRSEGGMVSVALAARDPLLDAIALSRGRFAVEVQGMAPLPVPAWPEVARVIDDCR